MWLITIKRVVDIKKYKSSYHRNPQLVKNLTSVNKRFQLLLANMKANFSFYKNEKSSFFNWFLKSHPLDLQCPFQSSGEWLYNVCLVVDECGEQISSAFIYGGVEATPGEFPFIALLSTSMPGDPKPIFKCSGVIINKFYILTAAHCIIRSDPIQ